MTEAKGRGRFIVVEGIDGSGKSTAVPRIADGLRERGEEVVVTREETTTWLGEAVRRGIQERIDPLATTFLFLADRAAHVEEIRRHLESGRTVVCDRFHHSTFAYQAVTLRPRLGDAVPFLRSLHGPFNLEPDRVVLLDVPVEVGIARAEARGETTPYEKQGFLAAVADQYRALAAAEPERFLVVDAAQSADAVLAAVLAGL